MDLNLKGKSVLITGSTSGIGYAIARVFLNEGAVVYVNGRRKESVNKAISKLKKAVANAQVKPFVFDFRYTDDLQNQLKLLPKVDILINNVGIYSSNSFFETSSEDWNSQFQVNVMSGVLLSQYFLPSMLQRNWGRIVFISSECAYLVPSDLIAYSTTKTALHAVSKGLSAFTKSTKVTVNTIVPGSTLTEGAQVFLEEKAKAQNKDLKDVEQSFFQDERSNSLLQRFATVEEVANTVAYICSPLASATNGSVVKVEGGSTEGIL